MALYVRGTCIAHLTDSTELVALADALLALCPDTLPALFPARTTSFSVTVGGADGACTEGFGGAASAAASARAIVPLCSPYQPPPPAALRRP